MIGVARWLKEAQEGSVVINGGNDNTVRGKQLNGPRNLSFDRQNNLYAVDFNSHRVQKFNSTLDD